MSSQSPYESAHQNASGPGDDRPTALQIIHDQGLVGQLGHLNIAITGGSTGLGKQTAKALHATGARIFILVPPGEQSETAAKEISQENKQDPKLQDRKETLKPIEVIPFDLGSFVSVRKAAKQLQSATANGLNVLVCNAGVMSPPFNATKEGFEPHFGINFLGHFLLLRELTEHLALGAKAAPSFASRVVVLSSLGHRARTIDPENLPPKIIQQADPQASHGLYNDSKLMLLWMANEAERRLSTRGIHSCSVNPGSIETPLTARLEFGWESIRAIMGENVKEFDRLSKSVEQGAATTVWAAVGKEMEGQGGLYLDDVQVALPAKEGSPFFTHGHAPHAYDRSSEHSLWKLADSLIS
ncbi:hypothetical protein Q7P37_001455 [Cladosporium fusiforme]